MLLLLCLLFTLLANINVVNKDISRNIPTIKKENSLKVEKLRRLLYRDTTKKLQSKIKILGDIEDSGWKDPYYQLAAHWAPVIHQDTDDSYYKGDYITNFDFDGDWVGNNNWENLDNYDNIWAYVYYAVIETETHYFIFYMFFHPRDWTDIPDWLGGALDKHENDMEGVMIVVTKDGSQYGSFFLMETRAHLDFYQYTNDGNIGTGSDDVDGGVIMDNGRPTVFIEAKGHGVYAWDGTDFPGGDGVIYYYINNQTDYPTGGNDRNVSYALVPIMRTLWPRRQNIGDGNMYDDPFVYSGVRYNFSASIGGAFDGDTYQTDKANPPWGMDDSGDNVNRGDWFLDCAYTVNDHLSIPYNFSLTYEYNPYLVESGPEFNSPLLSILEPVADSYVMSSDVNITWNVSDEYDLYNLTVSVDGEIIYSAIDQGVSSIIVNLEDGKHSLNICAMDIWGNYKWVFRDFYVDSKAPRVSITQPENNTYANYTDISLQWSGYDENNVTSYDIYVDNQLEASLSGDENSYVLSLSEGQHKVDITATDSAGRTNTSEIIINIDLTKPSIDVTSPNNNSETMYNATVYVKWNASDNMEIDHYEIKVDNESWRNVYMNTTVVLENLSLYNHTVKIKAIDKAGNIKIVTIFFRLNPSEPELTNANNDSDIAVMSPSNVYLSWSIEGDYDHVEIIIDNGTNIDVGKRSCYILRNLDEGIHNITLRVVYPSGEYVDKTYKIMVDMSAPLIETKTLIKVNSSEDSIVLEWNSTDELSGVEHYEVLVDGSWIYLGNNTNYTLDVSSKNDGKYLVIIRSYDKVGNYGQKSVIIIIDRTAPTLNIIDPSNGTYISRNNITISIEATDGESPLIMEIYLNAVLIERTEYRTSYLITGLAEGENRIRIRILDSMNNYDEETLIIYVDSIAPNIEITEPSDGEEEYGSNITVRWYGDPDVSGYYVRLDDGKWIYVGSSTEYTFENVSGGDHAIYVMAIDDAMNKATDTIVITVVENKAQSIRTTYGLESENTESGINSKSNQTFNKPTAEQEKEKPYTVNLEDIGYCDPHEINVMLFGHVGYVSFDICVLLIVVVKEFSIRT